MNNNSLNGMLGLGKLPTHSYEFGGKAFTTQELWMKISEKMNIIIEHFNYLDKQFTNQDENVKQKLDYLLGEGLAEQVARKLLTLVADGTLGKLINETLLTDINKKVDDTKTELDLNISKLNEILADNVDTLNQEIEIVKNSTNGNASGITNNANAIKIINYDVDNIKLQNFFTKIKNSKSKLLGHRGLNNVYPENTTLAIQKACELGFFGVEFDILQTQDKEFVVIHDETVDRTTNGSGYVSNLTLAQIKNMKIDGGNGNPSFYHMNLRVPTLEEVLNIIQRYNTYACIEMKSGYPLDYEKFISLINRYGLEEKTMILSFDYTMLQEVRNRNKNIIIAFNADMTTENIEKCRALGNSLISSPLQYVTTNLIVEAHKNGVGVIAYSANSNSIFNEYLSMGVDLMTTDILVRGGNLNV